MRKYGSILGTNLLCFYFCPLCYAAVLLKFTYYAQYYAEEQELLSDYYAIYIQFCMNNSPHVADNSHKTVLIKCINKWYQSIPLCSSYHAVTVLLEYTDCSLQFSTNA